MKAATRKKQGKGIRRKVEHNSQPSNKWYVFLRIDENESELFRFLSNVILKRSFSQSKLIICAFDETVIYNQPYNSSFILPCTQEEADTQRFVHVQDMSRQGIHIIKKRSVDTDVVVIAIALYSILNPNEI